MNSVKVIKNAGWIIICRVIQAVLQLVVSMLTARYLGPSNYGLINYAASLVTFVVPVMQLGLNSILVQEIIEHNAPDGEIMGTALVMNFVSAITCIIGVIAFVSIANAGERMTMIVCSLYSILLVFQAFEVFQYWFQAKLLSKYTSIISLVAYFIVSIYKVWLLIYSKSVCWFAVSNALDYLLIAVGLIIIFKRLTHAQLSFSKQTAFRMIGKSRYYIVSALMVTVFAQTDRIMLKIMINDSATGFYSAAVACAGMTSFIFSAVIDSARPLILESKKSNNRSYEDNLIGLYSIITYLALAQSIAITIFAKYIVQVLYGSDYAASVPALQLVVWYTTFSYMGSVRNIWILAENKQKYLWIINLSGASINVFLNYLFIPNWGIMGASFASLVTQFFTNFIISYLIGPIKYNNTLFLKGLHPQNIISIIHRVKHFS